MNKKQLIRDALLIGIVIAVIGIIYLISVLNRKPGEVATISYSKQALFSVDLNDGKFEANTTVYEVDFKPEIKDEKLYINDILDERLEKGNGVIVYENVYVILGYQGYVMIEYNPINKTIKVLEETSAYNICSTQGESKIAPIICLPNRVEITFGKQSKLDGVI